MLSMSSFGQVGTAATNFSVTDLDGGTHNLYSLLNTGYVVILDCSATWCGPCWGFHNTHYLLDIHETYGPDGTNQVRVIFYEADGSTTLADLQGSTGGTQGDWLTGSTYPFINESPITLSGAKYWPLGFPTINVISPSDKMIKADLWDTYVTPGSTLADIVDVFDDYFAVFQSIDENTVGNLAIYPNPANQSATISFESVSGSNATIQIYSVLGELMDTYSTPVTSGNNQVNIDLSGLASGQYVATVKTDENLMNLKFNVVH